eukprot:9468725-Pyramimonas_sp.AAC.1
MEGCSFSKCGPRLSTARIRLTSLQELHAWRAAPFQNVALALSARTGALKPYTCFTDFYGWRPRNDVLAWFRNDRAHQSR